MTLIAEKAPYIDQMKIKMEQFLKHYKMPSVSKSAACTLIGIRAKTVNKWIRFGRGESKDGEKFGRAYRHRAPTPREINMCRWFVKNFDKCKGRINFQLEKKRVEAALGRGDFREKGPDIALCGELLKEAERGKFNPVTRIESEHKESFTANIHVLARIEEIRKMAPEELTLNIETLSKELGKNGSSNGSITTAGTTALIGEREGITQNVEDQVSQAPEMAEGRSCSNG